MSGIDEGMMPEHVQPQRQDDGTRHDASDKDLTQKQDAGDADHVESGEKEASPAEHRAEEPKPVGGEPDSTARR